LLNALPPAAPAWMWGVCYLRKILRPDRSRWRLQGEPRRAVVDDLHCEAHGRRAHQAAQRDHAEVAGSQLRVVYVFDLGDDWAHLCTVGPEQIDPVETVGILPDCPLPYWGWGDIPDQYRRRWEGDDGESPRPKDPSCTDLPPLRPDWGPEGRWRRP